MAKADDTSSIIDWIWLYDAHKESVKCFGSDVLAEKRMRAWLASGQLPWSCLDWEGPNADDVARLQRENEKSYVFHILPSAAYHNGDPAFWRANPTIWWEKNAAREFSAFGARALGIKVSRTHLAALLPEEPRENKKEGRQHRRVLKALKKLYPPDGKVPDDISTEVVRGQVAGELSDDSKNRGLADPSWDTINRALGRD